MVFFSGENQRPSPHLAVPLFRAGFEEAGASHLHSLGDAPPEAAVAPTLVVSERRQVVERRSAGGLLSQEARRGLGLSPTRLEKVS